MYMYVLLINDFINWENWNFFLNIIIYIIVKFDVWNNVVFWFILLINVCYNVKLFYLYFFINIKFLSIFKKKYGDVLLLVKIN